jgi:peptidoglycan/LPS O-acetylase OafA/YrhL
MGIKYRPEIDGLRAIAVIAIVAFHAGVRGLDGGFVGVDVFFVLSGYLISSLLQAEYAKTNRIDFAAFYARRFKRLAPALFTVLAVTALVAMAFYSGYEQSRQAEGARAAALWVSNLYFPFYNTGYFDSSSETNLFLHTWSLGVEEQFYLVWPLLLLTAAREGKIRQAMWGVFGISLAVCIYASYTQPTWAFYLMPTRAWQFALGALIVGRTLPRWTGWTGVALIAASVAFLSQRMTYPGALALIPALGTAMALASAPSFLMAAPLRAIGRVSYSWYLWHWPAILVGDAVLFDWPEPVRRSAMVALSLALAVVSYRLIEKPVRAMTFRPKAVIGTSIVAMLAFVGSAQAWGVYWKGASDGTVAYSRPTIYAQGCDDYYRAAKVKPCRYGDATAPHVAVIMGDSIALQWFPALEKIYTRPGWQLVVLTKSGCPMVDEPVFLQRLNRPFTECDEWRPNAIAEVAKLKPDVLLLGSSHTYPFTREQWIYGTERVLASVSAGKTIILGSTPLMPFDGPRCLGGFREDGCETSARDEKADKVFGWIGEAARRQGADLVSLSDLICDAGTCKARRDGIVVFQDQQHLNADFVLKIADKVAERL